VHITPCPKSAAGSDPAERPCHGDQPHVEPDWQPSDAVATRRLEAPDRAEAHRTARYAVDYRTPPPPERGVQLAEAYLQLTTERDRLRAELDALRAALGLQPGEAVCGIPESEHACARICLLPARHIEDGRWHAGIGGSWSLRATGRGEG
jgi:hypothetical protein